MSVATRIPSVEPLRPESVASVTELRRGADHESPAPVLEAAPRSYDEATDRAADKAAEGPMRTTVDPALACLPTSVDVAAPDEARCDHAEGGLPCVRRPHPEHPNAHVRVAGSRCNALAARDVKPMERMTIAS